MSSQIFHPWGGDDDNSRKVSTMQYEEERALTPGKFYWVIPAHEPNDYGENEWMNHKQPARFDGFKNGIPHWRCLGIEESSDWPMIWIGSEVVAP